jgi:two-component sensor histidine kinase
MRDYISQLVTTLFDSFDIKGNRIHLRYTISQVRMDIDRAIPCGLIVNELVSNSIKYGFPEGREGTISVALSVEGDYLVLQVSDTGIGLPTGFDISTTESLGLQLVDILSTQLGGSLTYTDRPHLTWTIRFPA